MARKAYTEVEIEQLLTDYIVQTFLYEESKTDLTNTSPLIESEIINSLKILTLISFIEEKFSISIASEEMILENFKDVNSIRSMVLSKVEVSTQPVITQEVRERKLLSTIPSKSACSKQPFFDKTACELDNRNHEVTQYLLSSERSSENVKSKIVAPLTLVNLLHDCACQYPNKIAYTFLEDGKSESSQLTYLQLDKKARAIAAYLRSQLSHGERVLLVYPQGLEAIAALYGCLYAGVVGVPALVGTSELKRELPRLEAIAADPGASLILTMSNLLTKANDTLIFQAKSFIGQIKERSFLLLHYYLAAEASSQGSSHLASLPWVATESIPDYFAARWRCPNINHDTLEYFQYASSALSMPKAVLLDNTNFMEHLHVLVEALTINQFSNLFGQQIQEVSSRSLIPIKPNGNKRPFFYVHGADGLAIDPILRRYIDSNRPFYGLQALGIDGYKIPHVCLAEMVNYYIQEIQTIQPEPPYSLGGRCTGGIIALEMAQELRKRGQQVSIVVMVDSPKPLFTDGEKKNLCNWIIQNKFNRKEELIRSGFSVKQAENLIQILDNNILIQCNYLPRTYLGAVTYFTAQEKTNLAQTLDWDDWIVNKLKVYEVPGNHLSMVQEPHVQVLAEKLNACLEEAD
ncbi:MAG TPA: AMP-binding protein [Leptolyngbyaceae cyanobacterium M33_DOE_097]|uniref:Carrier domain-containing protein n=1 Tax=Oscillatoriales cyanobacterium SpSt-418 TaxID=2282169 RepID=A0A7C3KIR8_9CYAN|nr:AMP-binding protein [Leptolyngbyaceae cyanobacterium M33_DOE_097]